MATVRALFGLLAIATPARAAWLAGYPKHHVNSTGVVFGGLFGVRELALAAIVFDATREPARLRRAVALNAACDVGDAAIAARALIRRDGIDRGAALTIVPALIGAAGWITLGRAARELT